MSTGNCRTARRRNGVPTWRVVRYADDFVVLVHGQRGDAEALREEIARVLEPLSLRLSPAKTQIVHLSEAFDFLGFRLQRRRKRGTSKWYVYTFIAARPVRVVKAKIRALAHRTSQKDLGYVLTSINMVLHGWANYFRHAIAQRVCDMLDNFTWRRSSACCANGTTGDGRTSAAGSPPPRAVAAGHRGGRGRRKLALSHMG